MNPGIQLGKVYLTIHQITLLKILALTKGRFIALNPGYFNLAHCQSPETATILHYTLACT